VSAARRNVLQCKQDHAGLTLAGFDAPGVEPQRARSDVRKLQLHCKVVEAAALCLDLLQAIAQCRDIPAVVAQSAAQSLQGSLWTESIDGIPSRLAGPSVPESDREVCRQPLG
jgi:hypothetical protein